VKRGPEDGEGVIGKKRRGGLEKKPYLWGEAKESGGDITEYEWWLGGKNTSIRKGKDDHKWIAAP
jgi:hypothetical protein